MKLTDGFVLKLLKHQAGGWREDVPTLAEADGLLFACPKCTDAGNPHAVVCWFAGRVPDDVSPGPGRWTPSGSGLTDLTLTPSVWLRGEGCGWHGYVRDGEAK